MVLGVSKKIMLRRVFATIWANHLGENFQLRIDESLTRDDNHRQLMTDIYDLWTRTNRGWLKKNYSAMGFCLEEAPSTGNFHIHVYAELKSQKRLSTFARDFGIKETAFEVVKDATGAYQYVTGTGVHSDKIAIARWQFGEFKLHGDSTKADLRHLVNLALDGATRKELFRQHPYAWCVHRDRMNKFYDDMYMFRQRPPLEKVRQKMVGFGEEE